MATTNENTVVPVSEWMNEHTGGGCYWDRREFEYHGIRFDVCLTEGEIEGHAMLGVYTDSDDISDVFAAYRYEITDENHDCREVLPEILEDLRDDYDAIETGCGGRGIFCIHVPLAEGQKATSLDVSEYVIKAATMIECIASILLGVWEESIDVFGLDDIQPIVEKYFKACGRDDLAVMEFTEIQAQMCGDEIEWTHPSSKRFIEKAIEGWDVLMQC